MKTLLKLSLAATAVITSLGAQAQEFPSKKDKTVTLVVPYARVAPQTAWPVTWPKPCASPWV